MDLSQSIVPKSDQLNADDLIAGPVTVTIESVTAGTDEQPVNVNLVEFPGRAYRPSKSMRRVMVAAWGPETSTYGRRRMTLFRNPDIQFGGRAVGGIEIAAMSDIEKPLTIALTRTRGSRKDFTVKPLESVPDAAGEWLAAIGKAATMGQLEAAWRGAASDGVASDPRVTAAKDAKKALLGKEN